MADIIEKIAITIFTNPMCGKCKIVKKILEKRGWKFTEIEHTPPIWEVYPFIIYQGKELSFGEFLQEIKK